MFTQIESEIIDFVKNRGKCSSKEVFDNIASELSYATLKRALTKLVNKNYIKTHGKGKGTRYLISPAYDLIQPIDIEKYYEKEIDEREIKENFNFPIITEVLDKHSVFTKIELKKLAELQNNFKTNIAQLSENEYKKEHERLAIDLSWKSSQIESHIFSHLWMEIKGLQE